MICFHFDFIHQTINVYRFDCVQSKRNTLNTNELVQSLRAQISQKSVALALPYTHIQRHARTNTLSSTSFSFRGLHKRNDDVDEPSYINICIAIFIFVYRLFLCFFFEPIRHCVSFFRAVSAYNDLSWVHMRMCVCCLIRFVCADFDSFRFQIDLLSRAHKHAHALAHTLQVMGKGKVNTTIYLCCHFFIISSTSSTTFKVNIEKKIEFQFFFSFALTISSLSIPFCRVL